MVIYDEEVNNDEKDSLNHKDIEIEPLNINAKITSKNTSHIPYNNGLLLLFNHINIYIINCK